MVLYFYTTYSTRNVTFQAQLTRRTYMPSLSPYELPSYFERDATQRNGASRVPVRAYPYRNYIRRLRKTIDNIFRLGACERPANN